MSEGNDLSRRGFLGAAAGATAAAGLGTGVAQAGSGSPTSGAHGDVALVNGKIHTFDEANRVVSQVLIRDGRFVAVGSVGGGAQRVINLRGRTVVPGLIDSHVHFIRIGQAVGHDMRRLETAFSIEEVQQVVADHAAEIAEGEWLTALRGLALRQWSDPPRHPTREELDEAAPNHPVVISQGSNGQTNTLGRNRLRELGVTVSDAGSANDDQAYIALSQFLTIETKKREMLRASEYALSAGLTTLMDDHGQAGGSTAGAGFLDRVTGHDHVVELWREKRLPVRLRNRFAVREGVDDPELLQLYVNHRWEGFGDDMMANAGIGEWAPRGDLYQDSLRIMAERSYLYHQHTNGDLIDHLDALEQFVAENPALPSPADLHWSVEFHPPGFRDDLISRVNDLGIGLMMDDRYLTGDVAHRWRTIVDHAQVPVSCVSDGARVDSLNPWNKIYAMVTGRNSAGTLTNEGEQITREEAVRLYSGPHIGWFSKEEDRLGGIGVGRYADLAVLEKDFFDAQAVRDEDIRRMRSVLTIVNGQVRYDAGVL